MEKVAKLIFVGSVAAFFITVTKRLDALNKRIEELEFDDRTVDEKELCETIRSMNEAIDDVYSFIEESSRKLKK